MPADQDQQMQSIFPDIPRESPEVDKDGNFTALWSLGFGALFQALQENFKNEGIIFPPLSTNNVDYIQGIYTPYVGRTYNELTAALPDISGQTIYNQSTSLTNQFVIAVDAASPPKVTLAEWVPLSVLLTNNGDPNGVLAGVLNWLCYDSAGMHLWICTASGAASGPGAAVWTQIT